MNQNPDIYLLYEYLEKTSFTIRFKVILDEPVDPGILTETAREAFTRFPYFSVKLGVDDNESYCFSHNDRPIAVFPERNERISLCSEDVNEHLFFITYRDNTIWFSCSHALCGGYGAMFWVKTSLYLYMTKKYGYIEPPADIKLPGTPIPEEEILYPDPDSLPTDEPMVRYTGGDTNLAMGRMLKFMLNPFAKYDYYFEISIPKKEFMDYAHSIDGSPNTILIAIMYKSLARYLKEKEGTHIAARVAADYRDDIGASGTYHDFVRFIHVKYEWDMKDEPISKLNMRARGALISQNQPELSYEAFRKRIDVNKGVDAQPTLKEKKKYAATHSPYRTDVRDVYTVSYVGQVDFGGMVRHIKDVYTISNGDLMLEVNAIGDRFNISYQVTNKDRRPLEFFLQVMEEEGIPYSVSDIQTRYLPRVQFPD